MTASVFSDIRNNLRDRTVKIGIIFAFTIAMIQIFREYGAVPDTLVTCVFAALAGECGIMGWIKTTKERKQDRAWQQQDKREAEREMREAEKRAQEQQQQNVNTLGG